MKAFGDVFPELMENNGIDLAIKHSTIQRISTNGHHDVMRFYIETDTLVPKMRIWTLEKQIKGAYFRDQDITITVIEHFRLSGQYTPERVYSAYRDSILEELYRYNKILYNAFSTAKVSFPEEEEMDVLLKRTIITAARKDELARILEKILDERCGLDLEIRIGLEDRETDPEALFESSEKEIEDEVRSITAHFRDHQNTPSEKEEAVPAPEKTGKALPGRRDAAGKDVRRDGRREERRRSFLTRSSDPNVLYGRENEDEAIPLDEVTGEMGQITVRGMIFATTFTPIRNEKTILTFGVTDFRDSITAKIFLRNENVAAMQEKIQDGGFVKVQGVTNLDPFDHDLVLGSIRSIIRISDFREVRKDTASEKRVELHCHTKMSDMDAVSNASDIIREAMRWGHRAIAITDHGNVQAFPEAYHTVQGHDDMKILYGMEAYLVDDMRNVVTDPAGQTIDGSFVVFDIETTGFSPDLNKIIEIGAVRFDHGEITDRFSEFVNPEVPIPYNITNLTSITDEDVCDAPTIDVILPEFLKFSEGAVFVAHNADFDMSFIRKNAFDLGLPRPGTYMDTVQMGRYVLPNLARFNLDALGKALGVVNRHHHRAVDDAEATAEIFAKLLEKFRKDGITELDRMNEACRLTDEAIRNLHPSHCIILAKNDLGRINLYRLVSMSHLKYYKRFPKIPKSELIRHREGLIIGSACSKGELYGKIKENRPEEEIEKTASFYDYLEIQPVGNNAYMLGGNDEIVKTEDDLRDINRRITELGERLGKPVCATCDVHFLDPEDEVYRRILEAGLMKSRKNPDGSLPTFAQPPLYLHTTDEMLREFSYLGAKKAHEVVIDNPNRIADMCEPIAPVRPDKCPPVIENSDGMLREICYSKAHAMYGEELPKIVQDRLDLELNSIISNGYAVMYIIAQKLVWKSNEDGYLVGSRGSVGSSFVATMAGITEVNPLAPHYRCPKCHYVDFDSEEVKAYAGRSGCDMPDRKCPVCGHYLAKEGFDIPFQTFLGFKGNKEPDIDLNFSGDYQTKAHKYTEVIFGEGQTFKAGTIGTLADKTAFGYIKNYYEDRGVHKRKCEINRLVQGCVGVRRTTGQHPGGIIVLPVGEEIDTFTPVQHPADDINSDVVTTHFDYHSIDSNLLKLDILGHQDPTMIRMLEDITGLHATEIPLDDKAVMSLFENTDALGVRPEDLWGNIPLGTLGIPEFGTDFAMQMLIDAKPHEFSDLIRIAGLAHGTDVWLGNAETLIKEGKATISTCIACRDDIMVYLMQKGLDPEESFTIMERVRKGKVAKGQCKEWESVYVPDMKAHGVPDWYIGSCEKIQYMFPKAHAAAYVMMAWRVAYCKVFYPLAYYASYFSIRATAFSYEKMCLGPEHLAREMGTYDDYQKNKDHLTAKDKDSYRDMRLVQEMYARGFSFLPIDLYASDARYFKVVDGKLLPPFNSIEGMGDTAAESLAIAAHESKFLSKKDIRERGKVSQTIVDTMERLGIINGLPEDNQLSMFDYMKNGAL